MTDTAPAAGAIWVTPQAFGCVMQRQNQAKPYIGLDYTLTGTCMRRTTGKAANWDAAWGVACEIDEQIAAERAAESSDPVWLTVALLAKKWMADDEESWAPRYVFDNAERLRAIIVPALVKEVFGPDSRRHPCLGPAAAVCIRPSPGRECVAIDAPVRGVGGTLPA